jgi:hypothetical protein
MMPPQGSKVTIRYEGRLGVVETTGTFISLIGAGGGPANAFVRLDGTDQHLTIPSGWIVERR